MIVAEELLLGETIDNNFDLRHVLCSMLKLCVGEKKCELQDVGSPSKVCLRPTSVTCHEHQESTSKKDSETVHGSLGSRGGSFESFTAQLSMCA
jgi:hypothetical protein